MSDQVIPEPVLPSSRRLIIALAAIAMISGVLVAVTYQVTLPIIKMNQQRALEKAIFKVLPAAKVHANFLLEGDTITALPPGGFAQANVFAGYDSDHKLVGLAMEASARGYQDVVKVLYAYDPAQQTIIGLTVLQSSETPGIGDKVDSDPEFLQNFTELDAQLDPAGSALANPIVTVKHGKKVNPWEIDGISGATITSTAIGKALNRGAATLLPTVVGNQAIFNTPKGED